MGLEHVAIDINNFDGEVTKIKSAGLKILEERVLPDGRRVCFFEGPEGVRLEFLEWNVKSETKALAVACEISKLRFDSPRRPQPGHINYGDGGIVC
jgi:hypothetical protein